MHTPVLLKEVIEYLDPQPNENFIDATIGEGGHTKAILEKNEPAGKVLGLEVDPMLYQTVKDQMQDRKRLILVNDSYVNLERVVNDLQFQPVNGILFDLGMCSWHIDESKRGFSYLKDEPLDMRFNPKSTLTAAEIINFWEKEDLEKILKEYGEEQYAKRIALVIKEERRKKRIIGTQELVEILKRSLPKNYDNYRLHPAARTFQALRIAVNNELENLKMGLTMALKILSPQGKIIVISFHSLEDRIVKNFFRDNAKQNTFKILTKKPITSSKEEIKNNTRSRSAKLRAAILVR
ncbi:MAG: 16S rRNA (cytosine(1402)-N(4))-methyltransferase RsmH [Candidatus Paceibacterota bacterium]|jgi:16S rRNA (cytosine1402-N4)-methyltransferase